jgi:hypothetical protein
VAAIVLLVGARPGKTYLFLLAVGIETLIDKLAAVV